MTDQDRIEQQIQDVDEDQRPHAEVWYGHPEIGRIPEGIEAGNVLDIFRQLPSRYSRTSQWMAAIYLLVNRTDPLGIWLYHEAVKIVEWRASIPPELRFWAEDENSQPGSLWGFANHGAEI